jgi:hypothetical protein
MTLLLAGFRRAETPLAIEPRSRRTDSWSVPIPGTAL